MAEEVVRTRKTTQRLRKKKKKLSSRGLGVIILVIALIGGSIFGYNYFFSSKQKKNTDGVYPGRKYTTFQEQVKAEYDALKGSFTGDRSEVDLVARYFATNVFTLWGVIDEDDYNGKDMIPAANFNDFDQQMKNNLVFQFNQIVSAYGADNLPIVTTVELQRITSERILYDVKYYDGYNTTLIMSYQDGTVSGTMNANLNLATQLLQNWVYAADVVFFWIPAEEGEGGEWKVGSMKDLISNKNADQLSNEVPSVIETTGNNSDTANNETTENNSTTENNGTRLNNASQSNNR